MKVLIACEFSGVVRDAFVSLGHDAMSCDLLPISGYDGYLGLTLCSDRAEIVSLCECGVSQKIAARMFDVSRPTVSRLISEATWAGVL